MITLHTLIEHLLMCDCVYSIFMIVKNEIQAK